MTLGFCENFPTNIHYIARFATSISEKRMQQILLETLERLNAENFNLEDITDPTNSNCTAKLELGIADTNGFSYLDVDETQQTLKTINAQSFPILDFMCAACYHRTEGKKKTPLRFDYFMLRFTFKEHQVEVQVCHERGPRYLSPEDLARLVASKVNAASTKKILRPVET